MAKQSDQIKLAKLAQKARKEELQLQLAGKVLGSPMVQMMGTVALAEVLENQGILSSRWAGALEGGIITMTALQALKDYGVIGAGMVGGGIGIGALTEGNLKEVAALGLNAIFPGAGLLAEVL